MPGNYETFFTFAVVREAALMQGIPFLFHTLPINFMKNVHKYALKDFDNNHISLQNAILTALTNIKIPNNFKQTSNAEIYGHTLFISHPFQSEMTLN